MIETAPPTATTEDDRPPGERYFRHPGDVVRLVLWTLAAILLVVFVEVATGTSGGISTDLGGAAGRIPRTVREVLLALTQVVAVVLPEVVVIVLALVQRRWRRLGMLVLAAAAGALVLAGLEQIFDVGGRVPGAITSGTWLASTRFPTLIYLAGAAAASTVAKPWLSRSWRRACDLALGFLALVMAISGIANVPDLLLAVAAGTAAGAALLVIFGAPNRRPSPAAVATALRAAGADVTGLMLERADAGRSQLYVAAAANGGGRAFVKVYGRDSRDADVLYRTYRTVMLRGANDDRPAQSLEDDVEHEALLLLLAQQAGVTCPAMQVLTTLPDGSVALGVEYVDGPRLDSLDGEQLDAALLDATWREVEKMHAARIAHRSLRAANILVADGKPVIIDFGFGAESASPRLLAIDRAELLASLTALVGPEAALASAARTLGAHALAAAAPYLQPLALSSATRKQVSKSQLQELRDGIATATGEEVAPLERLQRVRPKTLFMIVALSAAFYVLLPQLADVGDSVDAIRNADWPWLIACAVLSFVTYIGAAIGMTGGVPERIPFIPTLFAQMASSFVNRVTPANVGGMALNVRYLQKTGVEPGEAVTGVGLNSFAGGIVHLVLLFMFVAWAGQGDASFKIPASSTILVVIAVVLALVGIALATRRGRRFVRVQVLRFLQQSWSSIKVLSRSPGKLAALFGGSLCVTLAYTAALSAAIYAFDAGLSYQQVGAVYLGASVVAAAAPTPSGLGAMEAALVAGLTGIGMEPGPAVAAVLSYRLLTYWLPILPGWLSFHYLERHNYI